jgi:1,5-anhydro-D-fructose reductase (1,5-anhydro-D-mannitol-forming)
VFRVPYSTEAHITIRWGIVGVGDVCEVKSGPGFQNAQGSSLVAVMRRDRAKADDFARRHGVPTVHATADALIQDPGVDAVYIATPPSSHRDLALRVAAAGKPCLVEKPMAMNHAECLEMIDAFRAARRPLWVAYYRRAQERFLTIRRLIREGRLGTITSVHVELRYPLTHSDVAGRDWHFTPSIAGAGLIYDVGSHCVDLLDFFFGPISNVGAFPVNTAGAYPSEDVTSAAFKFESGLVGTGIFNFHAFEKIDRIVILGSRAELTTPVFSDDDVVVRDANGTERMPFVRPAHVHQPLIQTIVDELNGKGRCESPGESGARASWVLDECVKGYYTR